MRLNTKLIGFMFSGIVFAGIVIANLSGLWITESEKKPTLIKEGEFAGMSNPDDIRGSYSFDDISKSFDVEPLIIAEAFGLVTDEPEDFKCNMLEEYYANMLDGVELGTDSIKQFVAIYTGLPYDGEAVLPSTAIEVLEREGKWTADMQETYEGMVIDMTQLGACRQALVEVDSQANNELDMEIKGQTTLAEVIDWGLSQQEIEDVLGFKVENTNINIKDLCEEKGLSFSQIKAELNTLLGQ